MKRNAIYVLVALISMGFVSCTKGKKNIELSGPNVISAQQPDPNLLLVEATVEAPKKLKSKVKKTDKIIWSLTNNKGKRIAHGMARVEKLPHKISVYAKQLITPIEKDSPLQLNVQIAKLGSEFKPVDKGWLVASSAGKIKLSEPESSRKKLSVGDKVNLELEQF